jgi:hypothetical protein
VILVGLQVFGPACFYQLDDPARVQVHAETDAAAMLAQVLDRQPQAPRSRRSEHQPVSSPRKVLVGERAAEDFVVDPEVLDADARLRRACRAAGLEHEDRFARQRFGDPPLHRTAAQPVVLERREAPEIGEAVDLAARIPAQFRRVIEPERGARCRIEMPRDHLTYPCVERGA